jgi:uncharacterized membrane protein YozB (DUF420 family)
VNAFIGKPLNFLVDTALDFFQITPTASFVIQLVVLSLLLGGVWLKATKKFRQHGIVMLIAVVLHAVMIIAWMMPSFNLFISPGSINLTDMLTVSIFAHAITGIVATIFGIWLVVAWRLKADIKTCFAKKRVMLVTITLWLIALVLGIILYLKILQLF